jgi:hypothetical protein
MYYSNYLGSTTLIHDLLDEVDSNTYNIVTKRDKKHNEAIRLIKQWNGINVNNIDEYLKQIRSLHTITTKILNNIEYTKDKDSMLSFIQGKFVNINKIIDSYNDYLDVNPFVAVKYPHLDSVDLKGVVLYD